MIELHEVVKDYGGLLSRARGERMRGLDGVTLKVPPGAALGVIGPNGAGKSTLIRLLMGYLHPTSGSISIDGQRPRAYAERHGVAYVPDVVAIPPGWTVRLALEAYAALGEAPEPHTRVEREMERFGVAEVAGRRVAALSRGNRQRVALAQAFLADRRLMILDEATDGLDPAWVVRVRERIAEWRAEDARRVLLFASHDLDEVERICDRAVMFQAGRIREVFELREAAPSGYRLEVDDSPATPARVRAAFPDAAPIAPATFHVGAPDDAALRAGLAALVSAGSTVRGLGPAFPSLRARYAAVRDEAPAREAAA